MTCRDYDCSSRFINIGRHNSCACFEYLLVRCYNLTCDIGILPSQAQVLNLKVKNWRCRNTVPAPSSVLAATTTFLRAQPSSKAEQDGDLTAVLLD